MRFVLMPPFLVSLMLETVFSDHGAVIPTKEEQANLLKNVEEVFTNVKTTVGSEGGATDDAVISDVNRMVDRAWNHLATMEELASLKIMCSISKNSTCGKDAVTKIQKIIEEGEEQLEQCIENAASNIHNNSQVITLTTGEAMNQGQVLLDTLNQCSKKAGLQQISCYKKIMTNDVFPLKLTILEALNMHKFGHLEAISIRNRANDCVDKVLNDYQIRVSEILSQVLASCM